jgi:hypothetical protein
LCRRSLQEVFRRFLQKDMSLIALCEVESSHEGEISRRKGSSAMFENA